MEAIQKSLGFNVQIFAFQIVLFVVLLLFMNSFFWKPILAHLLGRDQYLKDVYHQVDVFEQEMDELRAQYVARTTALETEARAQIQHAVKEAQAERERLLAEARERAEAIIRQNVADIEREKTESFQVLRERMIGIATHAADTALGSSTDPAALRRTIESKLTTNVA